MVIDDDDDETFRWEADEQPLQSSAPRASRALHWHPSRWLLTLTLPNVPLGHLAIRGYVLLLLVSGYRLGWCKKLIL